MRITALMPDEVLRGYLSRLRSENVDRNDAELAAALSADLPENGRRHYAEVILSELITRLRIDASTLARQHTMMPLKKCLVTFDPEKCEPPSYGDPAYLVRATWKTDSPARLCRDCVTNDLARYGFSYWRRAHQIPGLEWCSTHGRPLSTVRCWSPDEKSPHLLLSHAVPIPSAKIDLAKRSPLVQRYATIALGLLERLSRPVHSASAARLMTRKAAAIGLPLNRGTWEPFLSKEAKRQAPEDWARRHFGVCGRALGKYSQCWIDQTGHIRTNFSGTTTFVLAMALLWDSPDEAVAVFSQAVSESAESIVQATEDWRGSELQIIWEPDRVIPWGSSPYGVKREGKMSELRSLREKRAALAAARCLERARRIAVSA